MDSFSFRRDGSAAQELLDPELFDADELHVAEGGELEMWTPNSVKAPTLLFVRMLLAVGMFTFMLN